MGISIPRNIPTPDEAFNQLLGQNKATFTNTNTSQADTQKDKIVHIPFDKLVFYKDQKYKMYTEEKLLLLADDIKLNGLLSPAIVRPIENENGMYEVLAGRNRTEASKLAKLPDMLCRIKTDIDDNYAKLIVNGTNLNQRQNLLPSEKAFGYSDYENALIAISYLSDSDNVTFDATSSRTSKPKVHTTSIIAKLTGDDRRSIQRYLRLAKLNSNLLDLVDKEIIQINAGVELSYMSQNNQDTLFSYITSSTSIQKIDIKQAQGLRALEATVNNINGTEYDLNYHDIQFYFDGQTRKPKEQTTIKLTKFHCYLPSAEMSTADTEEYIIKALEFYKNNGAKEFEYEFEKD